MVSQNFFTVERPWGPWGIFLFRYVYRSPRYSTCLFTYSFYDVFRGSPTLIPLVRFVCTIQLKHIAMDRAKYELCSNHYLLGLDSPRNVKLYFIVSHKLSFSCEKGTRYFLHRLWSTRWNFMDCSLYSKPDFICYYWIPGYLVEQLCKTYRQHACTPNLDIIPETPFVGTTTRVKADSQWGLSLRLPSIQPAVKCALRFILDKCAYEWFNYL